MQVVLFIHTLADDALKVYNGFQFNTSDDSRAAQEIIGKFEEFAVGEINETYEKFIFNKCCHEEGEMFDRFLSDLKRMTFNHTSPFCDMQT